MTTQNKAHLALHTINPNKQPIGTVIWMHGLGADNRNFDELVPAIEHYSQLPLRFIFPNAPVRPVAINGNLPTRAWFDIYSLTNLDQEDETGIRQSEAQIQQIIEAEIAYGTPVEKITLAGYSQGGAMALHTGLRLNKKLCGVVGLSCYLPLPHHLAIDAAQENRDTPIFLAHGTQDEVLPLIAGQISRTLIQPNFPHLQWQEYNIGHEISMEETQDLAKWLTKIYQ